MGNYSYIPSAPANPYAAYTTATAPNASLHMPLPPPAMPNLYGQNSKPLIPAPLSYAAVTANGVNNSLSAPIPKKSNVSRFTMQNTNVTTNPTNNTTTVNPPSNNTAVSNNSTIIYNPNVVTAAVPSKPIPTNANTNSGKREWPASLKSYVVKAFAETDGVERTAIEEYLKKLIENVTNDGRLAVHKWDLEPLPYIKIKAAAAAAAAGNNNSNGNLNGYGVQHNNHYGLDPTNGMNFSQYPVLSSNMKGKQNNTTNANTNTMNNAIAMNTDYIPLDATNNTITNGTTVITGKQPRKSRFADKQVITNNNINTHATQLSNEFISQAKAIEALQSNNSITNKYDIDISDVIAATTNKRKLKKLKALEEKEKLIQLQNKEQELNNSVIIMNESKEYTHREQLLRAKRAERFELDKDNTNNNNNLHKKRKLANILPMALINNTNGFSEEDFATLVVSGTCTKLEKEYFRLTSPPDPSTVRPEYILRKHLNNLKEQWKLNSNIIIRNLNIIVSKTATEELLMHTRNNNKDGTETVIDYVYLCSQMKAIRQDLTVQHIKNSKSPLF